MKRFFSNFFYFGLFKGLVRPVPSQPVRALFAVWDSDLSQCFGSPGAFA